MDGVTISGPPPLSLRENISLIEARSHPRLSSTVPDKSRPFRLAPIRCGFTRRDRKRKGSRSLFPVQRWGFNRRFIFRSRPQNWRRDSPSHNQAARIKRELPVSDGSPYSSPLAPVPSAQARTENPLVKDIELSRSTCRTRIRTRHHGWVRLSGG